MLRKNPNHFIFFFCYGNCKLIQKSFIIQYSFSNLVFFFEFLPFLVLSEFIFTIENVNDATLDAHSTPFVSVCVVRWRCQLPLIPHETVYTFIVNVLKILSSLKREPRDNQREKS